VSGVRATAFRGAYGSTERAEAVIDGNVIHVGAARGLAFREGLTAVAGWNPGVVERPTAVDRTAAMIYSNLPLAIPAVVFVVMLQLWRSRGRDPQLGPRVTQYEPPERMSPAEVGTLVDGRPDMRDITATIVDLAVRGILHIAETEDKSFFGVFSSKDYRFTLAKPREQWGALKPHERDLLNGLFGASAESVDLSDLKNSFYKHLPGIREGLYADLVDDGLYTGRPDRVRLLYIVGGIVGGGVLAVASGTIMSTLGMQPAGGIIAGIATAIVVALFGWFMPARTERGTREMERVLGFQEFLARVEADRIDRVVKTPEMFEKFLPYAMALGVAETWAKAFEGICDRPPEWYSGPAGVHMFRPTVFASDLGRMSAAAATTMSSAPRSSGGSGFSGGSSGGGFGGGGGGGF
jgi:uncharacterized membrane protein